MDAREQLLQAAIKVYSTSGVRGATTKRIAHEAGVNEVTLFRHFGSKEALLHEALALTAQVLFESGLPAEPADPATELRAFARNHYTALWEHRELIRVAMGEFADHPESTHVACQASARFDRDLKTYLSRLKSMGLASGEWEPEAAASMLLGTLFSDVMGRDCMPQCYAFGQDAAVEQYLSLFFRAIGVETGTWARAARPRPEESMVLNTSRSSIAVGLLWLVVTLGPGVSDVQAQSSPAPVTTRTLTLDEALSVAERTSERVAIAQAGVSRAEGGRRLARSERLPQLFGSASYDRTLKSEFEGLFDTGTSDPGTGSGDDVDFSNLPFGQANVYRFGLSFSQVVYTGGRIRAQVRQADIQQESAGMNLVSAQAQNTLDVAEAFYDAALTDRLVAIAEETYAQADRSLKVTEEQRAAGRLSEFELLRARVARDSLQPSVVRARNNRDVAYLRLKQLLDLPLGQPLTLTADLDAPALSPPTRFAARLAEAESQAAVPARVAVLQVANEVRVADAAIAIARSERRPAVSLRSDYGLVDYPEAVPNFQDWRQNWTIGIGLSLPIFDGGRISANQAIARANAAEVRATLRLTEELAALDRASTRSDLAAAGAEWEASASTIQQAQRAYEIAELRYTEGLSTQLELSDARLQLAQSLATRAEAARNLQVRRVRFALLPELPLAAVSASAVQNATSTISQTQNRTQTAPAAIGAAGAAGVSGGR